MGMQISQWGVRRSYMWNCSVCKCIIIEYLNNCKCTRNVVDKLVITCIVDTINTTITTSAAQNNSFQQSILLSLFFVEYHQYITYKKSSIFVSQHVKINNIVTNKSTQREYYENKEIKNNMLKIVIIQKKNNNNIRTYYILI